MRKRKTKIIFQSKHYLLGLIPGFLMLALWSWQLESSAAECNSISCLPSQTTTTQEDSVSQEKLEELERRAEVYRQIIEIKQKQSASLNNQMELLDNEIQAVQNDVEINKRKIEDLNKQISDLKARIQEKEEKIEAQKVMLAGLMESYYEFSKKEMIGVLLSRRNLASFMVEKDQISQVGQKIDELIDGLKDTKTQLEAEKSELEKKKNDVTNLHIDLEDRNSALAFNRKQKEGLLAQTKGEEMRYQQLLKKTREQIQAEIEQLELAKSGVDLGPLPPAKPGFLAYPVNPVVITQKYGKTSFSKNYFSGLHNGVDFGIDYSSVYAAGSGKILKTGDNGKYAYGKWVAIDHGNGLVTLYGHLSRINVTRGEKIETGERIGISGDTGFSTGPHLHFTVFASKTFELVESKIVSGLMLPTGTSLNPMSYF